jgi:hypothetical protein
LIKLNPITISSFADEAPGMDKEAEAFCKLIEDNPLCDFCLSNEIIHEFVKAIETHFNLCPDVVRINDDDFEKGLYLKFTDEDKHIQIINPAWEKLPIEPDEKFWWAEVNY